MSQKDELLKELSAHQDSSKLDLGFDVNALNFRSSLGTGIEVPVSKPESNSVSPRGFKGKQPTKANTNPVRQRAVPKVEQSEVYATVKRQSKPNKTLLIVGDYQLGDKLGKGAFGTVYKGLNVKTGTFAAIKRLKRTDLKDAALENIMKEVSLLEKLQHKNIVKYLGLITTENHINIVLEYVESGSLAGILDGYGFFPEPLVAVYISQVLEGLIYLHESGIIHRDIKGANILITKEGVVKLADFGIAINTTLTSEEDCLGSPNWMAPEVIEMQQPTPACDIWSLGCTIIELLTGSPPYGDIGQLQAMFKMVNEERPPFPTEISPELRDFLTQCFRRDPVARPTARALMGHQWIVAHTKKAKPENIKIDQLPGKLQEYKNEDRQSRIISRDEIKTSSKNLEEVQQIRELARKQIVGFLIGGIEASFVNSLPLSSYVLLKFLKQWDELHAQNYSILTYFISSFSAFITSHRDDNNMLAFSLSNMALLLHLAQQEVINKTALEKSLKITAYTSKREFPFEELFSHTGEELPPDIRFCRDLGVLVATTFGILLGNVFDSLKPLIVKVIEAAPTPAEPTSSSWGFGGSVPRKNSLTKPQPTIKDITDILEHYLICFQNNFVYLSLSRQFFEQVFTFIDTTVFNDILTKKELCSCHRGAEIQLNLSALQLWVESAGPEWLGDASGHLKYVKQAVNLFHLPQKSLITNPETRKQCCPDLNSWQIKQLLSSYQPATGEKRMPFSIISSVIDFVSSSRSLILVFDSYECLPLSINQLHYITWDDLQALHFPAQSKRQMLNSWIQYSTKILQDRMDQPTDCDWSRLLMTGLDFACSELQTTLAMETLPQRKTIAMLTKLDN